VQPESKRPKIFWTSMMRVNLWRIDMEHKTVRAGFKASVVGGYFEAQRRSVLQWKYDSANGGPLDLLDMHSISDACGPSCSRDGIHHSRYVDYATIQVMANMYSTRIHDRGEAPETLLSCQT
jgi:hypothetical protein